MIIEFIITSNYKNSLNERVTYLNQHTNSNNYFEDHKHVFFLKPLECSPMLKMIQKVYLGTIHEQYQVSHLYILTFVKIRIDTF